MGKGAILELHVGVEVDLGGFGRFVAQPEGNDGEVHPARQKVHGRRVTKGGTSASPESQAGLCRFNKEKDGSPPARPPPRPPYAA